MWLNTLLGSAAAMYAMMGRDPLKEKLSDQVAALKHARSNQDHYKRLADTQSQISKSEEYEKASPDERFILFYRALEAQCASEADSAESLARMTAEEIGKRDGQKAEREGYEIAKLKEKISEAEARERHARLQLDEAIAREDGLKASLAALEADNAKLQSECSALEESVSYHLKEVKKLKVQSRSLRQETKALSGKLKAAEEKVVEKKLVMSSLYGRFGKKPSVDSTATGKIASTGADKKTRTTKSK